MLQDQIQTRKETRSDKKTYPEYHVAQDDPALEQPRSTQTDQRNLQELHREEIASNFSKEASHDKLMDDCREEKGNKSRRSFTDMKGRD